MNHERFRGWLGVLMPMLSQASPVFSLFTLVLGAVMVWWLLGSLNRSQQLTLTIHENLLKCLQHQVELVEQCRREK